MVYGTKTRTPVGLPTGAEVLEGGVLEQTPGHSVEEIVLGRTRTPELLTSANMPHYHPGEHRTVSTRIFLVRVALEGMRFSTQRIHELLDSSGFEPESITALQAIEDDGDYEELFQEFGVKYIVALGSESIIRRPAKQGEEDAGGSRSFAPYLECDPKFFGYNAFPLDGQWTSAHWFVCRRKSQR